MKFKVIMVTVLAIMAMLVPTVGVLAQDISSGSGSVVNAEPITVTYVSCSPNSTFVQGTNVWTINLTGGGTATLVCNLSNNSDAPITVTTHATIVGNVAGTAVWQHPIIALAAKEQNFSETLTVVIPATSVLGTDTIAFSFTR